MKKTALIATAVLLSILTAARGQGAKQILEAGGVRGGLVVHLGCGDGKLTAELRANDSCIVHGLDADAGNVAKARANVRQAGLYGKVSVAQLSGASLPYADNLVNLLVADDLGKTPMGEVMRVLVPQGVAIIGGKKTVKPRPADIDDWSHYRHDASNNAVANDTRVGPPKRLKWACGPLWARSHEFNSSTAALISAGGRLFYIFDRGLTGVTDKPIPERWTLIARDAFNGILLWDRPMDNWGTSQWKSKALRSVPKTVPRRIVSDGDRLFVTLEYTAPVSILDAATGKVLAVCEGSDGAHELRCSDGVVLVRKGADTVMGFDATSGKELWSASGKLDALSLAAAGGKVFYQSGTVVTCLDLKTGKELWKTKGPEPAKKPAKPVKKRGRGGSSLVIVCGDTVLFNGPQGMQAVSCDTGKTLWTAKGSLGAEPFIAGGYIWQRQGRGLAGISFADGKSKKEIGAADVFTEGHHARCYQSKATVNYVITPNRGVEFVSLTGESNTVHDWTRGACIYGIMPGNGLLYVPPDPCFCYTGVKVTGFHAMDSGTPPKYEKAAADRLVKGPAFGKTAAPQAASSKGMDWPTYRHDGRRSGGTPCEVSPELTPKWKINIKGKLTPPVVAGKRLYLAAKDEHTIYAINTEDGATIWRFIADGPIDSPPTIHDDTVLFGSADGWVYSLRASDGELAWRFRAAPSDRLIVNFGQLESAWRVHGSVLLIGDVAYCTAGRSTYLDGGIRVFALDAATGKVLHETCIDTWAKTRKDAEGKPFIPGYHMEGAFSDVLVSEGDYLYMGQYKLDRSLKQQPVPYSLLKDGGNKGAMGMEELLDKPYAQQVGTQKRDEVVQRQWQLRTWPKMAQEHKEKYGASNLGERTMGRHVFATGGFLDDEWYNRTFWMYAETWPGFHHANWAAKTGQLLTVDDKNTYAVQAYPRRNLQSPLFTPGKDGYMLFADTNDNEPIIPDYTRGVPKGIGFTRKDPPVWFKWVPLRIRAMVAAKNALFVAGAPDVLDPDDIMGSFEGRKGASLWAVSKTDGRKLAEYKLDFPPVFDGLIAADGRLFVVTIDGSVRCYAAKK